MTGEYFMIGVAAEMSGMHPQTLRVYERRGLIAPRRTARNTRVYSRADVALLRRIGEGEAALSPPVARRLLDHFRRHATFMTAGAAEHDEPELTARENDVLGMIARGLTLVEAGKALGISRSTVASHVKTVYRKLGVTSRAEAALEATRRRLT